MEVFIPYRRASPRFLDLSSGRVDTGPEAGDQKTAPTLSSEKRATYRRQVARMIGLATNFENVLARLPKAKRQVYIDEHTAVGAARRRGETSDQLDVQLD